MLLLIAVLWIIRDHRTLARYTYTSAFVGLALLATLVFAPTQNGARIALPVLNIQPGEFSKILLMIFFAGYLVRKREVLSVVTRSFLGLPLPRARDMGPLLLAWITSLLILAVIKDLGTSLLFFGIFLALLYVATERASWVVIGLMLFAGERRPELLRVRPRPGAGRHLAAPVRARRRSAATPTSWCRGCSGWPTAACSAPGSAADGPTSSPRPGTTSSSPASARRSAPSA